MTALRELAERKYSDAQLTEVARALCRDNSQVCNVNNDDNWKMYSEDYIAQAHVALAALAAVKILDAEGDGGAVGVPYAYGCDNEVHGGKNELCSDWCGREGCVTSDPVANRLRKAENVERKRFSDYNKNHGFTYAGDWIASWMNAFRAWYLRGNREAVVSESSVDDSCEVCHKPIADNCACQDKYRSEHDSRSER